MLEKLEKFQILALSIVLALGLVIAVKTGVSGVSKNSISVTGSAYEIVQSDSGSMSINLQVRASSKAEAYKIAKVQLPKVLNYFENAGFSKDNIEVKAANGYVSYRYNSNGTPTGEILHYNFTQRIEVKSNDVDKIKNAAVDVQNLVSDGIDVEINEVQYYYSKLPELKVSLLEKATQDAKQRASAMLKATHNRAGKIQSVNMGVFQITPVDSTNVSDMGINDTSTIEKKVTAVANVVFRIK